MATYCTQTGSFFGVVARIEDETNGLLLMIALPASAAGPAPSLQAEIRRNSPTVNGGVDG
jgi:hypothetical protein